MWSFVQRRPAVVAAVVWLLLLGATTTVLDLQGDGRSGWAGALSVAYVVYAVGASWYFRRRGLPPGTPAERAAALLFALAVSPWVAAAALAFLGAAPWTLWAALLASGLLLGWWAVRPRPTTGASR